VGFEMYTSMLAHAVNELKGEEQPQRATTQLNLAIGLRIEESYIEEENQRLRIYKKIAGAQDEGALAEIRAELEDRYGELPPGMHRLLEAASLRLFCERVGVAQVDRKRDQFHVRFTGQAGIDPGRLMKLVAQNAKRGAQFTPQGVLRFPLKATEPKEILNEIRALLETLTASEEPVAAVPQHQRK
jgi:transcription-repair coupling factor (superfamily II helicase)